MKIKTPVLFQTAGGRWWSDRHGRDWLCSSSAMEVLDIVEGEVFRLIISTKKLKNATKMRLIVADEVFIRAAGEDYELNELPQKVLLDNLPSRFTKAYEKSTIEHCKIWVKIKSYGVPHTSKDEQREQDANRELPVE